ncbi:SRPBCC family protein [Halapricum salinum]|uniref:SRPBCC family protein n=1 Tax=Halapricum salinum TaxID=1457250 RepID=A0A4D6HGA7_9EURY|nr:SRPBCC family protein [Halapricum salinum]
MGCVPRIERIAENRRLVVEREMDAPAEAVWDVLRDTTLWPRWGPSVTAVECDRRYIERGTTGRVRLPGGVWIPFEITTCENYRWTWTVSRIPATGHSVEPLTERRCVAAFDVPLVAAGYLPVCRRALSRIAALAGT